MTSVQFLFATTDGRLFAENPSVLAKAGRYLVVDQLLDDGVPPPPERPCVEAVRERGLARSRNRALALADAEIVYLCDDDVDLVEGAADVVARCFAQHPRTDVIVFATGAAPPVPGTTPRPRRSLLPARLRSLGAQSIQLGFRRRAVLEAGVRFDDRFGLGSTFPTGEEAIFLADCLRTGLTVAWVDSVVALHPADSSGRRYPDTGAAESKGAVLARVFPRTARCFFLPFALKSRPLYRHRLGTLEFLRALERGARRYRELPIAARAA